MIRIAVQGWRKDQEINRQKFMCTQLSGSLVDNVHLIFIQVLRPRVG